MAHEEGRNDGIHSSRRIVQYHNGLDRAYFGFAVAGTLSQTEESTDCCLVCHTYSGSSSFVVAHRRTSKSDLFLDHGTTFRTLSISNRSVLAFSDTLIQREDLG